MYFTDELKTKRVGAWCAATPKNQWLQVDLGSDKYITAVGTQGNTLLSRSLYTMDSSSSSFSVVRDVTCDAKENLEKTSGRANVSFRALFDPWISLRHFFSRSMD